MLGRWRALPLRGPPRTYTTPLNGQRQHFAGSLMLRVFYRNSKSRPGEGSQSANQAGRQAGRQAVTRSQKNPFSLSTSSSESPPYSVAAFVVNSEPHIGARGSHVPRSNQENPGFCGFSPTPAAGPAFPCALPMLLVLGSSVVGDIAPL